MSVGDEGNPDEVDFSWGVKMGIGGKNRDLQLYQSFTYGGVEYFLYDSVYLFEEGVSEPYIGKLIQIYERPTKERMVRMLWFFHPSQVSNFLGDVNVLENELFLATGCGRGLTNINPLEAIAGKCNVVCISKDQRNRQPSIEEVKMAHYVFYRTFDVEHRTISDILGEKIATVKVNYLLNNNDFPLLSHAKLDSRNMVVRIKNPPISANNTLVADKAVENNSIIGSPTLKDDNGAEDILNKSEFCPSKTREDAQCDDTGLIKVLKDNLVSNKANVGADENVLVDALVKDNRGLNKKGDVSQSDNTGSVVLDSCQKISLRLPDSKKAEVDKVTKFSAKTRPSSDSLLNAELGKPAHPSDECAKNHEQKSVADFGKGNGCDSVPSSTGSEKGIKVVERGIRLGTGAVRKLKSVNESGALEERPFKKQKHNGVTSLPMDDAENNKHNSADIAAITYDKGKMGKQLDCISSKISRMPKSNNITENKPVGNLHKLSTKQPVSAAAKTSDRSQLGRVTSHGLSKKPKFNVAIEHKSIDKVAKVGAILSKDMRKSALPSSTSDKAPQCNKVESGGGANRTMGLYATNDGLAPHTSKGKLEEKSNFKLHGASIKQDKDTRLQAYGRLIEVTERPRDESKWVRACDVPWEERMKEARDRGTLVLLLNLDPTYTSYDVENIVWHGLGYGCTAKMLPQTAISSPHSGQAFTIFKHPEAAKKIMKKLDEECLMLPNGRALVGISAVVSFSGKKSSFPGHLVIDKLRHQMSRESRDAVSTSHTAQANNLEYEMALDWRELQEKSNLWWKTLYKKQSEEIESLKARLKSK